jgi:divalent metal cation (Fe/Co/Zn/Cd) transporter
MTTIPLGPSPAVRAAAVRRGRLLNRLTIGWNAVEGLVAVVAGVAAGSVSLVGFGLDSGIEVSAAVILAWRLAQERRQGCTQAADRRSTRVIAVSFFALAAYVGIESIRDLLGQVQQVAGQPPRHRPGWAVAGGHAGAGPAKRRVAPVLGSRAAVSEANQTSLCALLSAVLLVGLAANAVLGWWWADPTAGLGIAALAAIEGVRTWRAESLADTCCEKLHGIGGAAAAART